MKKWSRLPRNSRVLSNPDCYSLKRDKRPVCEYKQHKSSVQQFLHNGENEWKNVNFCQSDIFTKITFAQQHETQTLNLLDPTLYLGLHVSARVACPFGDTM